MYRIWASRPAVPAIAHVAITGASSGLGAALAEAFAAPGVRLALSARNVGRLERVAAACQALGAEVESTIVDVTDRDGLAKWLTNTDERAPVDLVIANAGRTGGVGPDDLDEDSETVRALFQVNVQGVVDTVTPLLPRMRSRRQGRIAVMSSLAALCPIPGAAGYSASKAAVKCWGEALRSRVAADGIAVSVVCPGFVETPMTQRLSLARPMAMDAATAAKRIRIGILRGRPLIAFPTRLAWGVRLLPLLPARWADALVRPFDYRVLESEQASPPASTTERRPPRHSDGQATSIARRVA